MKRKTNASYLGTLWQAIKSRSMILKSRISLSIELARITFHQYLKARIIYETRTDIKPIRRKA
jgi:hypothetical protein